LHLMRWLISRIGSLFPLLVYGEQALNQMVRWF
jgi:hypothetical protein